jgi:hypothetical protein
MVQIKYPGRQQLWSNSTQENNPSAHSIVSFMENAKAFTNQEMAPLELIGNASAGLEIRKRETHRISLGMAPSLITCQNLICNLQTVATGQEAENSDQESSGKSFCLSICFNQQ